MDFIKLCHDRYSCKRYSAKPVEEEKLSVILEAARLAPTAKNNQPYHIYVVKSPEKLAVIDSVTPCRYGAPVALVFTFDKNNVFTYPGGKYSSGAEDTTIVATHAMLGAASVGVDSCWLNFFDPDKLAELLALPENEQPVLILDIGYADEGAGPLANHEKRNPIEQMVTVL